MASTTVNSLESLGWRFFKDKDCLIPWTSDIGIKIDSGVTTKIYLACVPQSIQEDGTVKKHNVYFDNYFPGIMLAEIQKLNVDMFILGRDEDGYNANGTIEEVSVWDNRASVSDIISFQQSRKSLFGDIGEQYFASKEIAMEAGVTEMFDFVDASMFEVGKISGTSTGFITGNKIVTQGINKPRLTVDETDEQMHIEELRIEQEFTINIKFSIRVGQDFTAIDISESIRLEYNLSLRSFTLYITEYFLEEQYTFETESIDHLYGKTNDLAIVRQNGKVFIVLNGNIEAEGSFAGEINGIDNIVYPAFVKQQGLFSNVVYNGSNNPNPSYTVLNLNRPSEQKVRDLIEKNGSILINFVDNTQYYYYIPGDTMSFVSILENNYKIDYKYISYYNYWFPESIMVDSQEQSMIKFLKHDYVYELNINYNNETDAINDETVLSPIVFVHPNESIRVEEVIVDV